MAWAAPQHDMIGEPRVTQPFFPREEATSASDGALCRRAMRLAWAAVAVFVIIDVVWLSLSPRAVAQSSILSVGVVFVVLCVLHFAPALIRMRLSGDDSPLGRFLLRWIEGLQVLVRAAIVTIPIGMVGAVYSYLATSAGLPVQDAALATLDRMLGFDWLAFLAASNAHWLVGKILVSAYHSALPQVLFLYAFLSFTRREVRLCEFCALMGVTSLAVALLMAIVPAAGAYAYYAPPSELFTNFSPDAGMWHYQLFTELRNDPLPVLDLNKLEGLVTFPSFHTVLAIVTAYAVRGVTWVGVPAIVLNAVVIVSTIPEGGHHLVDVIAGGAIAVLSIVGVRLYLGLASPFQRPLLRQILEQAR